MTIDFQSYWLVDKAENQSPAWPIFCGLPCFQPGCRALNKMSIEFSNHSKIIAAATSSSSIRGLSVSTLFLDEFAFVQNATEFYTSTYPVISSGQNTKVIITSTANGIGNMYYQLWEGAVQGINEYSPFRVDWWDVPGRDEEWKRQTIANTSETQFKQEFQNQFLGTSNTLIESDTLLGLQTRPPEQSIHSGSLRIYEKPIKGHVYLMSVDVSQGRGQDYSAFSVVDITSRPFKQVVAFNDNKISPLLLPNILLKVAQEYNNAIALIENNGPGQVVCNSMYYDFEYDNTFVESAIKAGGIGVTTTRKIKSVGMSNLKDLIESGNLQIWDSDTVGELCTFEARGSSYEGKANSHDDLVMSLVLFAWFVSTEAFGEFDETQLRDMVFSQKMQEIEDEMLDFGFVSSNNDQFDALPSEYAEMKDSMEFWSNL